MRFRTILAAALLVAAAQFAAAAAARDQFNQKDAVTIDPQKSYIFYRARSRLPVRFIREASPEEIVAWRAERAAALVRAQAGYERDVARYRLAVRTCETRSCRDRPEPPVRATEENFDFPPPEADNFLLVASGPQFSRDGEESSYLVAVPPGTYAIYGSSGMLATGVAHMCQCMGTVRFAAPAGQVVDLGMIRFPYNDAGLRVIEAPTIAPYTPAMARPPRLNGLPVIPAELRAADKIPNYLGGMINRHPALPGVLRYERDRVIDDRTGRAPAP
jgi:hypothetical protein